MSLRYFFLAILLLCFAVSSWAQKDNPINSTPKKRLQTKSIKVDTAIIGASRFALLPRRTLTISQTDSLRFERMKQEALRYFGGDTNNRYFRKYYIDKWNPTQLSLNRIRTFSFNLFSGGGIGFTSATFYPQRFQLITTNLHFEATYALARKPNWSVGFNTGFLLVPYLHFEEKALGNSLQINYIPFPHGAFSWAYRKIPVRVNKPSLSYSGAFGTYGLIGWTTRQFFNVDFFYPDKFLIGFRVGVEAFTVFFSNVTTGGIIQVGFRIGGWSFKPNRH